MRRYLATMVAAGTFVLAGCAPSISAPDRRDEFVSGHANCTASWWLEDLRSDVPTDAETAAEGALHEASVSSDEWQHWEDILIDSQIDSDIEPTDQRPRAYAEVVRAHVRDRLANAGYPDANRLIEVRADVRC